MEGRSNLKASLLVVDPGYDGWVVARVVEEVPDEDIQGRQGQLGCVLPGSPSLSLAAHGGGNGGGWGSSRRTARGSTRWRR